MLTHEQIWSAIDRLAAREGISVSALAKRAGLDATTFNRSKRLGADGHPRWPSTESIAKILAATGASVDHFLNLIAHAAEAPKPLLPFIMLDALSSASLGKDGPIRGVEWDRYPVPGAEAEGAFACAIAGEAGRPLYRPGDVLIAAPAAELRAGDIVIIVPHGGKASLGRVAQISARQLHITALDGTVAPPLARDTLALVARVLWASQ